VRSALTVDVNPVETRHRTPARGVAEDRRAALVLAFVLAFASRRHAPIQRSYRSTAKACRRAPNVRTERRGSAHRDAPRTASIHLTPMSNRRLARRRGSDARAGVTFLRSRSVDERHSRSAERWPRGRAHGIGVRVRSVVPAAGTLGRDPTATSAIVRVSRCGVGDGGRHKSRPARGRRRHGASVAFLWAPGAASSSCPAPGGAASMGTYPVAMRPTATGFGSRARPAGRNPPHRPLRRPIPHQGAIASIQ
jgi:hypothetical protein